jgi:hypothetical protein
VTVGHECLASSHPKLHLKCFCTGQSGSGIEMQIRKIQLALLLLGVVLFAAQGTAEPPFRKLAGKQIAAEVAGMELTDHLIGRSVRAKWHAHHHLYGT